MITNKVITTKIYDISMQITEKMMVYPGDPKPKLEWIEKMPKFSSNLTRLTMGAHTGTHVDTPKHEEPWERA